MEELKIVTEALTSLAPGAKEAFIWWLAAGVASTVVWAGVVARDIIRAIYAYLVVNRRSAAMHDLRVVMRMECKDSFSDAAVIHRAIRAIKGS